MNNNTVGNNIWKNVKKHLIADLNEFKIGSPEEPKNFINAVISETAFDNITSEIEYAKQSNKAEIIAGGNYDKSNRGKTYVFVTNVKNGTNHEISVVAGFNYKKNTKVKFTIDKNTTLMFPIDDRAWSESSKVDKTLVRKMKKGNKLVVEGTSSPGNVIIDHYSLSGFTKALALIDKNCS